MNSGIAKAVGSGLAGALTTILVWALNQYAHALIPDYVQGAISTVISTAVVFYVPNAKTA